MARPYNTPDVFRAVAHPARRKMLVMLRKQPRTAAELAEPFNLGRATISEHLRTLRLAGLIESRTLKNKYVYTIVRTPLRAVREWANACA